MKQVQKAGDNAHQVQVGGDPDDAQDVRRRIARPYALFAVGWVVTAVLAVVITWAVAR